MLNRSAARKAHLEQQMVHEKATSTEAQGSEEAAEKILQQTGLSENERREMLDGYHRALSEIRRQHRSSRTESLNAILS